MAAAIAVTIPSNKTILFISFSLEYSNLYFCNVRIRAWKIGIDINLTIHSGYLEMFLCYELHKWAVTSW